MKLVRKKLTADEFSPGNKRYVIEDDMVQTSPDGGTTWYDDPAADPRHNPTNLLPARTGGDPRCDAAESMTQHFRAQVDAVISGGNIITVVNLLVGLLLFIPGVNVLVALLFSIADALFTIGVVVVDAAMTDPVYDQIKCILYCHIDDQGQMSAEQLAEIYTDVDSQIGGVAATVFQTVTSAWGEVGFSNAGASGEYTGDCEDCACAWCYEWTGGEIATGGWSFPFDGQGGRSVYINASFTTVITHIEFTYTSSVGSGSNGAQIWQSAGFSGELASHIPTPGSPDTLEWDGELSVTGVGMGENAGDGGTATITHVLLKGIGALPAFTGGNFCDP